MPRPTPRPVAAALAILLAGALPATPALAVPGCANPPTPSQPVAEAPWPLTRYAPDRLAGLATGAGTIVAVVDSGVDHRHPQLTGQVLNGRDFLDPGGDGSRDCVGHGTAVASVIAATPGPDVAFRGLAPGARILPVRISEQQVVDGGQTGRTVSPAVFAQAIRWAVDRGAGVLNLSVVLYADHPAVRAAIGYALSRDVVVVAAAGNLHAEGDPRPYPAAYNGVIGVGAIAADGSRADFSQVGGYVDVVAPGSDVLTAAPGRGHRSAEGTSYATPFVAATAALLREYRPELTSAQIAQQIMATADPAPGPGAGYGAGVLNPYRAVTETTLGTGAGPRAVGARLVDRVDPAQAARDARRADARSQALRVAAVIGALAATASLLALVVPRGARRRWRPG